MAYRTRIGDCTTAPAVASKSPQMVVSMVPRKKRTYKRHARNAVRYERRLQLAMEGQRLWDLRRWGIADVTLNSYINGIGGGAEKSSTRRLYKAGAEAFAAKHRWYPLPAIQIELSRVAGED